ncbi:MAG: hypothetical protein QME92_09170 [Bacillota bacterium]|nr:hypothetical protein [Bacillota bacterium]
MGGTTRQREEEFFDQCRKYRLSSGAAFQLWEQAPPDERPGKGAHKQVRGRSNRFRAEFSQSPGCNVSKREGQLDFVYSINEARRG